MPDALTITPTMLRQWVTCERLVWLDQYGDAALRTPLPPMQAIRMAQGVEHEEAVQQAGGAGEAIEIAGWDEGIRVTRALMDQGVDVIVGAYLERLAALDGLPRPVLVRGRVDRLVRQASVRGALNWTRPAPLYQPVEIKRYTEIGFADQLQLDAYLWMLQAAQAGEVGGWFWMGEQSPGAPATWQEHEFDPQRLLHALTRLAAVMSAWDAPPVRLERHCKTCVWYASCRAAVEPQLPLSLLSGVSRQAREHLRASGITSLRQIAEMQPDDLRRFKGIKTSAPAVHANARAYVEKQPIWFGPLPEACAQGGLMFDLETDPYTMKPWSWGWCDTEGHAQVIIVAHREASVSLPGGRTILTVRDSDAAWRLFAELNPHPSDWIYHWTAFDAGVMRASAPPDVRQRLEARMHDLHHSYKTCVRFPVDGASLKVVARYLEFEWAEYDAWDAAYHDYRRWLSEGDLEALSRACNYQQADVQALAVVWKWLVASQT